MTAEIMTAGEEVENTLVALAGLIGVNNLPAPGQMTLHCPLSNVTQRGVGVTIQLRGLPALRRWADATGAEVVDTYDGYQHTACTVFGETQLRMTAFGKALTP
jgi:hypothetical protein